MKENLYVMSGISTPIDLAKLTMFVKQIASPVQGRNHVSADTRASLLGAFGKKGRKLVQDVFNGSVPM